MTASSGLAASEFISNVWFNFNPDKDQNDLSFTPVNDSAAPATFETATRSNEFRADGADGYYDIRVSFSTANNDLERFTAGESVIYDISYALGTIDALDFQFYSDPRPGNNRTFFTGSAAHVQGIAGGGGGSGWIADMPPEGGGPPGEYVPIPAAAWLFGSALLGLIGVARRAKA